MMFLTAAGPNGLESVPVVDWPEDAGRTDMVARVCFEGLRERFVENIRASLRLGGYTIQEVTREQMLEAAREQGHLESMQKLQLHSHEPGDKNH